MRFWRRFLLAFLATPLSDARAHDGVYLWPFRDESGKIVRWYGTSTDIESVKQTERKLREDERELRQLTDTISQTIVVLDPLGTPLYANQATLEYSGLSSQDVLAPDFRERLFHPEDLERLRDPRKNRMVGVGKPLSIRKT